MPQSVHEQFQQLGFRANMLDPELDFSIINLGALNLPLPFQTPAMQPSFFVLNMVKQARGWYLIDGQRFSLNPCSIFFIRPGHYRTVEFQELSESYLVALSESFLKESVHPEVFEEFPFLLTDSLAITTIPPAIFAEFEHLYQQLLHEFQAHSPFRPQLIGHLLVVLLFKFREHFWVGKDALSEGSRSADIVRHFQQTLEQQYRNLSNGQPGPAFRIQDYAAAQHLHPSYLAQVIKKSTGKSVGAWIMEKTIAEAKAQLQHTRLAVKEVAYQLGFAAPAHFSSYFKKYTGLTPQQYRLRQQPAA